MRPAITRVAEWSRVDTGVGPSIASFSQVNDTMVMLLTPRAKSIRGPHHVSTQRVRSVGLASRRVAMRSRSMSPSLLLPRAMSAPRDAQVLCP